MSNILKSLRFFLLAVFLLTALYPLPGSANTHTGGKYSTVVDEQGNVVYVTAWIMNAGDEVLTENNKRYEIIAAEGERATAKLVGEINLAYYETEAGSEGFWEPSVAKAQAQGKVAIYHTHSDESYVPTDGVESIAGGGTIYKVGERFKNALEKNGMQVFFSDARHDPHDDMAYERSRRTAMRMVKNDRPDAIFDLHRDAVPKEVYGGNINGEEITKVQLVVGKHGPTGKQTEEYAMKIKAAADKKHPGLVKGIFFAKGGDYNQDLHPRSMLVEVGAHTNDRVAAEKGIAMFADVVPVVLAGTNAAAKNAEGSAAGIAASDAAGGGKDGGFMGSLGNLSGSTKSIAVIIGMVVLGTAAFLYLSTGSFKEAKGKLKQFVTTEFANFLGPKKKLFPVKPRKKRKE